MPQLTTSDSLTVSRPFIADWLRALDRCGDRCGDKHLLQTALQQAGLSDPQLGRVGRDQIVTLYQQAATSSGDEMTGLWSRPIRSGALKHLLTTMRDASTLPAALYRFTTFWNLLLDDYQLDLSEEDQKLRLSLRPRASAPTVNRFGHMLMLKLAHGLLSWLAGRELQVAAVGLAFPRPDFAADYAVLFPVPVSFNAKTSCLTFHSDLLAGGVLRSDAELLEFLQNAPRDWIFTGLQGHSVSLQLRAFLASKPPFDAPLPECAAALGLEPRTLMRRLRSEATSFQGVKDGLRRDLALRALLARTQSVEEISQDLGFSSSANFHRAFRRWTGRTPGQIRAAALGI
ncbi:Adenosine deaminase [Tritonibacter multivorans]|uniref:Adenosine deaminase n=1 Tax=Tritonibacter multivorans TaxID=928856 RepID=A0A0P1FZB5_9RHOB|nr:AraC family transcriptional regulator [Tritonibacter multivorans]MDA7422949.1 AraC family transcriptional regulator ligand-binding domain-containing protein [Tritonibacter multivorans]CUH74654.1 Adenosine deaminase [Tritonibacter multivorans]SFD72453.1 AraC-type DNA-binding protein [Tritonibacter multivorans]